MAEKRHSQECEVTNKPRGNTFRRIVTLKQVVSDTLTNKVTLNSGERFKCGIFIFFIFFLHFIAVMSQIYINGKEMRAF